MPRQTGLVTSLTRDSRGMATVEYALLGALVALVAIGAWTSLGEATRVQADEAASVLGGATTAGGEAAGSGRDGTDVATPSGGGEVTGEDAPEPGSSPFHLPPISENQHSEVGNDNVGLIPGANNFSRRPGTPGTSDD